MEFQLGLGIHIIENAFIVESNFDTYRARRFALMRRAVAFS